MDEGTARAREKARRAELLGSIDTMHDKMRHVLLETERVGQQLQMMQDAFLSRPL